MARRIHFTPNHPSRVKKASARKKFRQLVVITGLSGAGKGSVIKAFEDLGFYCVDNLPVDLITKFAELCQQSGGRIERAAVVV
ncbi:MAG: RNase adapter RapZ, partial [Terriglobia bacterium]